MNESPESTIKKQASQSEYKLPNVGKTSQETP